MSNLLGGINKAKSEFLKHLQVDKDYREHLKNSSIEYGTINIGIRYYDLSQYKDLNCAELIKKYIKEYKINIYDKTC